MKTELPFTLEAPVTHEYGLRRLQAIRDSIEKISEIKVATCAKPANTPLAMKTVSQIPLNARKGDPVTTNRGLNGEDVEVTANARDMVDEVVFDDTRRTDGEPLTFDQRHEAEEALHAEYSSERQVF
jgi:hypothetical protein